MPLRRELNVRRRSIFMVAAEAALWTLVFFCPLALASAPSWTLLPLAALSGIAVVSACVGAKRQGRSLQIPPFAVVLAVACALCMVQLIPLPWPVLDAVSPPAAALRD